MIASREVHMKDLAASRWVGGALAMLLMTFAAACGPGDEPLPDGGTPDGSLDAGDGGDGGLDGGPDGGNGEDGGDGGEEPLPEGPMIQRVFPPRGPVAGNTVVVLQGRGFVEGFAAAGGAAATEKTSVRFGSNDVIDFLVVDDDTVEVRSPPGVVGTVDIVLTNPAGTYRCEGCFSYHAALTVDRVAPSEGASGGGDLVTLSGKGFSEGVLVLFGGVAATEVTVGEGGTNLVARTPPASPGSVDVTVVGAHSAASLRRSYLYVGPMRIASAEPSSAPLSGGVDVRIRGEAFSADAQVYFGELPATQVTFVSPEELLVRVPPAAAAGAVPISVEARRGAAVLHGGFAYFRPGDRNPSIYAAAPRQGPASGGTCAASTGCVTIIGAGLSMGGLSVKVGGADATIVEVLDESRAKIDLPPGTPGLADVQLRTNRGGAILRDGFAYLNPLRLDSITPSSGPAIAPGEATLSGSGFDAACTVTIGAAPAEVLGVSETQLRVAVPTGSPGGRDVRVSCGGAPGDLFHQEAVLRGGFRYETPLQILQVTPEVGSIAGNTAVTVYGAGFAPGMEIAFGVAEGSSIEVLGPHLATVRAPRAPSGPVDVAVRLEGEQDVLPAGYTYFDPTNANGGASGGPMQGTLNVTVLNETPGMRGPVEEAVVTVDDRLVGITDARGQVTFSDPYLLKPVSISATKPMFSTATLARVDARNVTLYIQLNEGDGEPPPPQPPTPLPEPAVFTGRVCGFKTRPDLVLGPTERLEARVYFAHSSVYATPPFSGRPAPAVVSSDCGTFALATRRYGAIALFAEFGIVDTAETPARFTRLLMGVRRGLSAVPDATVDTTIVLDMHLDVDIPISIGAAHPAPGFESVHSVYSYLDLGGEGIVPLAVQESMDDGFLLENHPRVSGDGLLFLNRQRMVNPVTGQFGSSSSFFFRRQFGDPVAGVEIGPMLSFTRLRVPTGDEFFTGRIEWELTGGQQADLQWMLVQQPMGFVMRPIWEVILPGGERSVSMHPASADRLDPDSTFQWRLTTARAPRFEYDRVGYQHLGINAWTAFTQESAVIRTP